MLKNKNILIDMLTRRESPEATMLVHWMEQVHSQISVLETLVKSQQDETNVLKAQICVLSSQLSSHPSLTDITKAISDGYSSGVEGA